MNRHIILTLIKKDLSLFFRNKLFAILTILGLVIYIVMYLVMPNSVNAEYKIGMYAPALPPAFSQLTNEGVKVDMIETEAALKEDVTDGKYIAGIALPADIMEKFAAKEKATITLYFTPDAPEEAPVLADSE